ncbi:MAG: hypothetical protein JRC68_10160 [Deltaproteobacteria bacterium]|nr:hypothetical protein [Deltaproteobacteria bacterium]
MIKLSHKPLIRAYLMDCMGLMVDAPDDHYDLDICEIDEEYFKAACERFERETRQQKLF